MDINKFNPFKEKKGPNRDLTPEQLRQVRLERYQEDQRLAKSVGGYEYPLRREELKDLTDGELLSHIKWLRTFIETQIKERDSQSQQKHKESLQDFINELYTHLNLVHKEFDERNIEIPK